MKSQKLSMFELLYASWESTGSGTASYFPFFSEIRVFQNHLHWIVFIRPQGYTLEYHFQEMIVWNFCFLLKTVSVLLTSIPSLSINMTNLIWNPLVSETCTQRSWRVPAPRPRAVYLPCSFSSLRRPRAEWYVQAISVTMWTLLGSRLFLPLWLKFSFNI